MFAKFYSPPDGSTNWAGRTKYITDRIKSYGYTAKFLGSGDFTMVLHFIPEIISAVNINDIIYYDGDWLIIKGIKYDETDGITLTGNDLNGVLSQRIAPPDQISGTSTAGCISHYLNNNIILPNAQNDADIARRIPIVFPAGGIAGNNDDSFKNNNYENLADIIRTLCEWADIGYRITGGETAGKLTFRLVKGTDRSIEQNAIPRVIFSPGWGNVIQQSFEHDVSNMYNAVYGFDSSSSVVRIGYRYKTARVIPAGLLRQEAVVDVTLEDGETVDNIPGYALAATEDNVEAHSYNVVPTADGFGKDYFLGDKVTVRDRYTNVNYSAVISEVEKNYSGGQKSIKVSVGKPNQKLLNMIINNTVAGVQKKR